MQPGNDQNIKTYLYEWVRKYDMIINTPIKINGKNASQYERRRVILDYTMTSLETAGALAALYDRQFIKRLAELLNVYVDWQETLEKELDKKLNLLKIEIEKNTENTNRKY